MFIHFAAAAAFCFQWCISVTSIAGKGACVHVLSGKNSDSGVYVAEVHNAAAGVPSGASVCTDILFNVLPECRFRFVGVPLPVLELNLALKRLPPLNRKAQTSNPKPQRHTTSHVTRLTHMPFIGSKSHKTVTNLTTLHVTRQPSNVLRQRSNVLRHTSLVTSHNTAIHRTLHIARRTSHVARRTSQWFTQQPWGLCVTSGVGGCTFRTRVGG
jgi:hypothetical protein